MSVRNSLKGEAVQGMDRSSTSGSSGWKKAQHFLPLPNRALKASTEANGWTDSVSTTCERVLSPSLGGPTCVVRSTCLLEHGEW